MSRINYSLPTTGLLLWTAEGQWRALRAYLRFVACMPGGRPALMVFSFVLYLTCQSRAFCAGATTVEQVGTDWLIESAAVKVVLDTSTARLTVTEKQTGTVWKQDGAPERRVTDVERLVGETGIRFHLPGGGSTHSPPLPLTIQLALEPDDPEFVLTIDGDRHVSLARDIPYPWGFALHGANGFLVVPIMMGLILPSCSESPQPTRPIHTPYELKRMSMPWFGATDLQRGNGYMAIVETAFDFSAELQRSVLDDRWWHLIAVRWKPSKGTLAYARRIRYCFFPEGGYVAQARRYREYKFRQTTVPTKVERAMANPKLDKLAGGVNVCTGRDVAQYAAKLKKLGFDRGTLRINATIWEEGTRSIDAVRELGFLPYMYGAYTDALPKEVLLREWIDGGRGIGGQLERYMGCPETLLIMPDGQPKLGWTYRRAGTGELIATARNRCAKAAYQITTDLLAQYAHRMKADGMFLDVTAAIDPDECYSSVHPMTREEDVTWRNRQFQFVREHGGIVMTEDGKDWAAPHIDLGDGMMTMHFYQGSTTYQYYEYNVSGRWRVPLYNLVYHDCVFVNRHTGDGYFKANSRFVGDRPPSQDVLAEDWDTNRQTAKTKALMDILYGNAPSWWHTYDDDFILERIRQDYLPVAQVHRLVAYDRLDDHKFLSDDHLLQKTRFSSGREVIVNLSDDPRSYHGRTVAPRSYQVVDLQGIDLRLNSEQSRYVNGAIPQLIVAATNTSKHSLRAGPCEISIHGPTLADRIRRRTVDLGELQPGSQTTVTVAIHDQLDSGLYFAEGRLTRSGGQTLSYDSFEVVEPVQVLQEGYLEIMNSGGPIYADFRNRLNRPVQGIARFAVPEGWSVAPASVTITLQPNETAHDVRVNIKPGGKTPTPGWLRTQLAVGDRSQHPVQTVVAVRDTIRLIADFETTASESLRAWRRTGTPFDAQRRRNPAKNSANDSDWCLEAGPGWANGASGRLLDLCAGPCADDTRSWIQFKCRWEGASSPELSAVVRGQTHTRFELPFRPGKEWSTVRFQPRTATHGGAFRWPIAEITFRSTDGSAEGLLLLDDIQVSRNKDAASIGRMSESQRTDN